jgi:hypothetical protein
MTENINNRISVSGLTSQYRIETGAIGAGVSPYQLLPANPSRVFIGFWGVGGGGAIRIKPFPFTNTSDGILLPQTGWQEFDWQKHGPIVGLEWWVYSTVMVGAPGYLALYTLQ